MHHMDRRRQSRVSSGIPVRIWGMDAKSRPFQASVSALNLSDTGALLQGVRNNLRSGDTIELQYEGQTTAYMVMWMGSTGTQQAGQVGLRRAANQPSPWSDLKLQYCVAGVGQG
jgi:hypothetical protein